MATRSVAVETGTVTVWVAPAALSAVTEMFDCTTTPLTMMFTFGHELPAALPASTSTRLPPPPRFWNVSLPLVPVN